MRKFRLFGQRTRTYEENMGLGERNVPNLQFSHAYLLAVVVLLLLLANRFITSEIIVVILKLKKLVLQASSVFQCVSNDSTIIIREFCHSHSMLSLKPSSSSSPSSPSLIIMKMCCEMSAGSRWQFKQLLLMNAKQSKRKREEKVKEEQR